MQIHIKSSIFIILKEFILFSKQAIRQSTSYLDRTLHFLLIDTVELLGQYILG